MRFLAVLLALASPAFHAGTRIPARYTCTGANVSPPLRWTAPPRATRSLALLVNDPDAPGRAFTHWTLWNLPATRRSLPAGFRWKWQGRNDGGSIGYTGPCPPAGPRHRYVFTVYALDSMLSLRRGASPSSVISAVVHHARSTATLVGFYSR
ncbi:MAG: YbhB/YbcL family Raf kinase inhibitor-like protein [Gaiellaceae bacterium]